MNARAQQILAGLDPEQRQVAEAQGGPVAVVAGPGTGKTRALTARLAYGAATGVIDPQATLAVTFTTRAAAELGDRLAGYGVQGVAARTFHSAALAQAAYFWPLAYGTGLPRVWADSPAIVKDVLPRFGLDGPYLARDIAQEIAWTKQSNVLPERYERAAREAGRHVAGLEPARVADLIAEYERVKQSRHLIDFDDILLCCAAVLEESEEAARGLARRYRHLTVDEFQDVSPIQSRLIGLWLGPHRDICVVGDPAQTIHGFAGARAEYLERFARAHKGARQFALNRNYRSAQPIVAAANALMRQAGGVALKSQRGPGPDLELAEARSNVSEAWAAAEWLADRAADGLAWEDMAVLYRGHAQAAALAQALGERSIPCHTLETSGRLSGPEPAAAGAGVTLSTLHAAKGREWAAVALVGVQDGLVPHLKAATPAAAAEERRLLYVGLTRAEQWLRLSWAGAAPSRFLKEAGLV